MNKKKVVIITSIVAVLILLVVGVSYAYYSANIKENNKTETVIKTNELTLTFNGTSEITASDIVPGESFTKTFTVENTSNIPVTYNIYLEDITNEFNEDLVYTLTDEDGIVVKEAALPSTNAGKTHLITSIEIDANELKEYVMTIEFKYSDKDQNELQGATFNATLGVDTSVVNYIMQGVMTDSDGNNITSGSVVVYSETPHYSKINSEGKIMIHNFYKGEHEIYYLDKEINIDEYTKERVIEESVSNATFTTSDNNITLENGYKLSLEYINKEKFCAEAKNVSYDFDYIKAEESFDVPCDGIYKLEAWGAQGGSYSWTAGGYGAYSTGYINLTDEETLYINVGGAGGVAHQNTVGVGGYNGGGQITSAQSGYNYYYMGSGGGATHIATKSGLLKDLSSEIKEFNETKGTHDSDTILIVAGGGGGIAFDTGSSGNCANGGSAGGVLASNAVKRGTSVGGSQKQAGTKGGFGFGASATGLYCGAGGGFYGGGSANTHVSPCAGGSSYIGNDELYDKVMYCYNCQTSDQEATKTISTKEVSNLALSNSAKKENGYARITYIGNN